MPERPSSISALVTASDPRGLLTRLAALGGQDLPAVALVAAAFDLEPSRLAAADLSAPAVLALAPEGWALALGAGDARAAEQRLGGRWRLVEDADLGAWITASEDAGAARPCALIAGAGGAARVVCGSTRSAVRALGPWLAHAPVDRGGDDLRVELSDDAWSRAWSPALREALRAGTDWLAERAEAARSERGAPTYGDPEPVVTALRARADDVAAFAGSLRALRGETSVRDGGIRVTLRASLADSATGAFTDLLRWGAAHPGAMQLSVPTRGMGAAMRGPDDLTTRWARDAMGLGLEVLGSRVGDPAAVRRSLDPLVAQCVGSVEGQVSAERGAWSLRVGQRDVAAARQAVTALAGAPWWSGLRLGEALHARRMGAGVEVLSGVTVAGRAAAVDGAIVLGRGDVGPAVVERVEGAVLGAGASLGTGAEGALRVWVRPDADGVALELRAGAGWLRAGLAAAAARDR